MAQGYRIRDSETEAFAAAVRDGLDSQWWRHFISLVELRRQSCVEQLCGSNSMTVREEDNLRGEIGTLQWIKVISETASEAAERISDGRTGTAEPF